MQALIPLKLFNEHLLTMSILNIYPKTSVWSVLPSSLRDLSSTLTVVSAALSAPLPCSRTDSCKPATSSSSTPLLRYYTLTRISKYVPYSAPLALLFASAFLLVVTLLFPATPPSPTPAQYTKHVPLCRLDIIFVPQLFDSNLQPVFAENHVLLAHFLMRFGGHVVGDGVDGVADEGTDTSED